MPIFVEATPKGFMSALLLTQTKGIVPENVSFIEDSKDYIMSKTEQLLRLLEGQFNKRAALVVSIEEVWIVGISGASFEWARELCQTQAHVSRWNLITDVTIPFADTVFNTVLFLTDIVTVLWHEYLSKTVIHPSIAEWKKDFDSGGEAIEQLLDTDDFTEMLKIAMTQIPKPLTNRHIEIPTESEPEEAIQFVSSASASFFHTEVCRNVKRIKTPVYYASIEEAEEAGKQPCSTCKPNGAE